MRAIDSNRGRDWTDKVPAEPQDFRAGHQTPLPSSLLEPYYRDSVHHHPVSPDNLAASTPAAAPFHRRNENFPEQGGLSRVPSSPNPYTVATPSPAALTPPVGHRQGVSPHHRNSSISDSESGWIMDDESNIGSRELPQLHAPEKTCSRMGEYIAGTDARLFHHNPNLDHSNNTLNYNTASSQGHIQGHIPAQPEPSLLWGRPERSNSTRSNTRGRLDRSSSTKSYTKQDREGNHDPEVDIPDDQAVSRTRSSGSRRRHQQDGHHHLRNDTAVKKQDSLAVHQHSGPGQKSGVPGRNGEEPETDLFNFVGIMLDMPEHPTWRVVIVKLAKALAVMTISYFLLMALYFGAEFQAEHYMKNFDIMVVNLDQGMIGLHYDTFLQTLNKQPGQPNWSVQSPTLYPTLSAIQEQVRNGRFWGAVVVQSNASVSLNQAYSTQFKNYDPSGAFAFIYDSGRDPLVVRPRIVAAMYLQFLEFSRLFNPAWVRFVLNYSETQAGFNITSLVRSPQVLGTPIAFVEYDLHPITAAIITSATSVAYIWIFLVAGGSTYLVAHLIQPMTRGASTGKTMAMLLTPLLAFVMVLSMTYSILLMAFGVPFPDGAPQFLSLFAGMVLLQCSVASMVLFLIYLIPVVFIPSFTITFVVMNVIAVFNPGELVPTFYRWVYAMPFLNAVQISRYVLMGSYNRLQYNVSILAAWSLIPILLLPFAIQRQKRMAKGLEDSEELREEGEKDDRRPSGETALQPKGQPKEDFEIRRHASRKERYGKASRDGAEQHSPWSGKSGESDWEDDVIRLSGELYRLENHPPAERKRSRSRRGDQRAHGRQEQARVSKATSHAHSLPAPLKALAHKSGASASAPSESRVFGRTPAPRSRNYDWRRHDEIAANMIPNEVKE